MDGPLVYKEKNDLPVTEKIVHFLVSSSDGNSSLILSTLSWLLSDNGLAESESEGKKDRIKCYQFFLVFNEKNTHQ